MPSKRFMQAKRRYWKRLGSASISDLNLMFSEDDACRIIHDGPNTAALIGKDTYFQTQAHELIYEFKPHSEVLDEFRKYVLHRDDNYLPSVQVIINEIVFRLTRQATGTVWLYIRIPRDIRE